jgi:hypothetical protein
VSNPFIGQIGGAFAPPLNDALLAEYREIIDAMPGSPAKDAMDELYACVMKWWELPQSERAPIVGPHSPIVMLDKGISKKLDPYVPWQETLDYLKELFQKIEAEIGEAASPLCEQWRRDVGTILTRKHFPDADRFYTIAKVAKLDPDVLGLMPANIHAEVAEFRRRFALLDAESRAVFQKKEFPGHPYPWIPGHPARRVAINLVWHAQELCKDREPVTADKLFVA